MPVLRNPFCSKSFSIFSTVFQFRPKFCNDKSEMMPHTPTPTPTPTPTTTTTTNDSRSTSNVCRGLLLQGGSHSGLHDKLMGLIASNVKIVSKCNRPKIYKTSLGQIRQIFLTLRCILEPISNIA